MYHLKDAKESNGVVGVFKKNNSEYISENTYRKQSLSLSENSAWIWCPASPKSTKTQPIPRFPDGWSIWRLIDIWDSPENLHVNWKPSIWIYIYIFPIEHDFFFQCYFSGVWVKQCLDSGLFQKCKEALHPNVPNIKPYNPSRLSDAWLIRTSTLGYNHPSKKIHITI